MQTWRRIVLALATSGLGASSCGQQHETAEKKEPATETPPSVVPGSTTASAPQAAPPAATTEPAAADSPAGVSTRAPGTAVPSPTPSGTSRQTATPAPPSAAATDVPLAATDAEPAAPAPAPTPAERSKDVVDVSGEVMVAPTKPGLTRVGANKCQPCHRVQFDSWTQTAHAKRMPPLDCEACHGPGSEYKTLAIMKDPVRARSAGLVLPDKDFCATCHRGVWSEDLLRRVHAHKPASP